MTRFTQKVIIILLAMAAWVMIMSALQGCSRSTFEESVKDTSVTIYRHDGRMLFHKDMDDAIDIRLTGDIGIVLPPDKAVEEAMDDPD